MSPESQLKSESLETVSNAETVRDEDKIMLVLAYFGVFALIPLLTVKDSKFVQWHAKQGLFTFGAMIATVIGFSIIGALLGLALSIFVTLFIVVLLPLTVAVLGIIDIVAMIKALGGERWRIPLVADVADRF